MMFRKLASRKVCLLIMLITSLLSGEYAVTADVMAENTSSDMVKKGEEGHFISINYDSDKDSTEKNYNNDGAKGRGGIAVGINAESEYKGSIAIGNNAKGIGFNGNDVVHYAGISIAIGEETNAKGGSIAIGEKAVGTVLGDVALGRGAKAEGVSKFYGRQDNDGLGGSVAIGNYSSSKGTGAIAIGLRAKATKNLSIAIGGTGNTKADGKYAIAIGDSTWALKNNSFAVGRTSRATAEDAIALGRGTTADGLETIALGQGAHATANGSVALGTLSATERSYNKSTAIFSGITTKKEGKMGVISVGYKEGERRIIHVAGGSEDTDAVNVAQLKAIVEKIGYTTKDDGTIDNAGEETVLARLDALEKKSFNGTEKTDGKIEKGNSGFITGGDVYDKWNGTEEVVKSIQNKLGKINADGNVIKKDSNISENLIKLDNQIYQNQQAISQMQVSTGKVEFVKTDTVEVKSENKEGKLIYRFDVKAEGRSEKNNKGLINGNTLYQALNQEETERRVKDVELEKAFRGMEGRLVRFSERLDKVGAGAAALAALYTNPIMDEDVWGLTVGYGHYGSENAVALGVYYHPNTDLTLRLGTSFDSNENMVNVGISYKIGKRIKELNYSRENLISYINKIQKDKQKQDDRIQMLEEKILELEKCIK